jgi:hypothetical protein
MAETTATPARPIADPFAGVEGQVAEQFKGMPPRAQGDDPVQDILDAALNPDPSFLDNLKSSALGVLGFLDKLTIPSRAVAGLLSSEQIAQSELGLPWLPPGLGSRFQEGVNLRQAEKLGVDPNASLMAKLKAAVLYQDERKSRFFGEKMLLEIAVDPLAPLWLIPPLRVLRVGARVSRTARLVHGGFLKRATAGFRSSSPPDTPFMQATSQIFEPTGVGRNIRQRMTDFRISAEVQLTDKMAQINRDTSVTRAHMNRLANAAPEVVTVTAAAAQTAKRHISRLNRLQRERPGVVGNVERLKAELGVEREAAELVATEATAAAAAAAAAAARGGQLASLIPEGKGALPGMLSLAGAWEAARKKGIRYKGKLLRKREDFAALLEDEIREGTIRPLTGSTATRGTRNNFGVRHGVDNEIVSLIARVEAPPPGAAPGAAIQAVPGGALPPPSVVAPLLAKAEKRLKTIDEVLASGGKTEAEQVLRDAATAAAAPVRFTEDLDAQMFAQLVPGARPLGLDIATMARRKALETLGPRIHRDYLDRFLVLTHGIAVRQMHKGRIVAPGIASIRAARSALNQMRRELGEQYAKVEESAEVVTDFYADYLDKMVANGRAKREIAEFLHTTYPRYNPIGYVEDGVGKTAEGLAGGRGLSVTSSGLRLLSDYGQQSARQRPLEQMVRYAVNAEMGLAQNDAARSIIKMARRNPDMAGQVVKTSGARPVAAIPLEGGGKRVLFRRPGTELNGTISYMENGDRQLFKVPKQIERAAKELANLQPVPLEGLFQRLNAVPRAFLTSANPAFFASNFVFDSMVVGLTRGVLPTKTATSLVRNMIALFKDDKVLHEMLRARAGISGFSTPSEAGIIRAAERGGDLVLSDRLSWQALFRHPIQTLERIGGAFEMAPRRAVFEQEISRGTSLYKAGQAARNATVDFQRMGQSMRLLNSMFLYLNAGVQGSLLPFRALRDQRVAKYGIAGYMSMSAALYAHNRQFEEYKDVPLFDKYTKIMVMLPSHEVDERGNTKPHRAFLVPTLREFTLFSAPLTYVLAKLDGQAPEDMEAFLKATVPSAWPASAITGAGGAIQVPTYIGETMREIAQNRDSFSDQPIVPLELQAKPAAEQFDEFTSASAVAVGRVFSISPKMIDHLMRTGLGYDLVSATDAIINHFAPDEDPEIVGLVEQLKQIQETMPADSVERTRTAFLRALPGDVRNEVRLQERKPQTQIPIIDSIIRRFYRTYGGQIYRTGRTQAAKALGSSPEQTEAASRLLGEVGDEMHTSQQSSDEDLLNRAITPDGWRQVRKHQGAQWSMALLVLGKLFPQAVQVLAPEDREAYNRFVHTVVGKIPDRRTRAQILYAGFQSIVPKEEFEGMPDLESFFDQREQYIEGLSKEDSRLLVAERRVRMTPTEEIYENSLQILRSYWSFRDIYEQRHPSAMAARKALEQARLFGHARLIDRAKRNPRLLKANRIIAQKKLRWRERHPEADAALRFWGYVDTSLTTAAEVKFNTFQRGN